MNNAVSINNTNKMVILDTTDKKPKSKTRTVATEKPKIKRIVTDTNRWKQFTTDDLMGSTAQSNAIAPLLNIMTIDISSNILSAENTPISDMAAQQIRNKISGYRSQDIEKGILDETIFIKFQDVLDLFKTSGLQCYYCKEGVLILYEYVRDSKQWTLERLDNKFGHNNNNVVLACLQCNLRRRCMHSDRYLKTKQMANIVKVDK